MAWTEFYMQTTGSDLNAGTTTADGASVTQTNGNWSTTTDRFIAASGTPFSGVSVGEWASIYLDAAVSAVYISQIVAVDAGGTYIDVGDTAKYGTPPTTGATGRSCKIGGAWASPTGLITGFASVAVPASTRINVKAGTYARALDDIVDTEGATTKPVWIRGYDTTPGDIDTDLTASPPAKPVIAYAATKQLLSSGPHITWSGISITGNISSRVARFATGTGQRMFRMRVENTSTNAAAFAMQIDISCMLAYSWFKAPTTGTSTAVVNFGATPSTLIGCVAEGGGKAGCGLAANNVATIGCLALNNTGNGFELSGAATASIHQCTVYNSTSDGIEFSGVPTAANVMVVGCLLSNCGGYGINNSTGTNTAFIFRACNAFYSCTSGNENGFGDSPSLFERTLTVSPFKNAAGGDFTLIPALAGSGYGFPGYFENQIYGSFIAPGAVQARSDIDPTYQMGVV